MPTSRLRRLREDHGLSLRDVAAITGISPSMLSLVERGLRELDGLHKITLARSLGVRVEHLFPFGEEDANRA